MDELEVIGVWLLNKRANKRKRNRKHWVHPTNKLRAEKGAFDMLFEQLRDDGSKFFNYYRMSYSSFEDLLNILQSSIEKKNTNMRASISPRERLSLTIRYLASGCLMTDLHNNYRIGISTISQIIQEVCQAIWNCMKEQCMGQPSKNKWLEISEGFLKGSDFPNCLGAIANKHVRVIKPNVSGSVYKKYSPIHLLAVCDASYRFTHVDIGDYGANYDSCVYTNSTFNKQLRAGALDIPEPAYLPGKDDCKIPFVLLGDEDFNLSNSMMRPYSGKNLPQDKKVFNYRLSRGRRFIECTFGILTNKWKILNRPLNVKTDLAIDIVKACVILHNYVRVRDGYLYEDTLNYTGSMENDANVTSTYAGTGPTAIRDYFRQYFVTEGDLPLQYLKI